MGPYRPPEQETAPRTYLGARHQQGVSAVALNPLGAVKSVKEGGQVTVAGTEATSNTGAIDLDEAIDQYERLSQSLPTTGASAAVPQGSEGAGGITGGRIEYRVEYTHVGEETTIVAPEDTQPIGDFARELQRILSRR